MHNLVSLPSGANIYVSKGDSSDKPVALIVHGWNSVVTSTSYTLVRDKLVDCGYHVVLLSLRSHGESKGDIDDVSRSDHLLDIKQAYDFARCLSCTKFIGIGTSYGGYLLAVAQSQMSFDTLILRAPAIYLDEDWEKPTSHFIDDEGLFSWRSTVLPNTSNRALQGIGSLMGRLLVIASEKDEYIPMSLSRAYITSAKKASKVSLTVLEAQGHVLNDEGKAKYVENVVSFLF